MSLSHKCPCNEQCPMQQAMDMIAGISNTMLEKSLRELEEYGLVKRSEYMEVPIRVEYEVTDKTKELFPILMQLAQWAAKS